MKFLINTPLAPKPIGPYTQGNSYRNFLFISGQIGLEPNSSELPESFEIQVKNALYNIKSVVEAGGSHMSRVLKVTVFLTDEAHFAPFNEVYYKFFPENFPARETVVVKALPMKALLEISAIAYVREDA